LVKPLSHRNQSLNRITICILGNLLFGKYKIKATFYHLPVLSLSLFHFQLLSLSLCPFTFSFSLSLSLSPHPASHQPQPQRHQQPRHHPPHSSIPCGTTPSRRASPPCQTHRSRPQLRQPNAPDHRASTSTRRQHPSPPDISLSRIYLSKFSICFSDLVFCSIYDCLMRKETLEIYKFIINCSFNLMLSLLFLLELL
jgi:hypothetical protein